MSLRRTGQDGLMLWLQSRTSGYKGVHVVDFTKSWENGLAFCALIHSFYPDVIPFDTLAPENKAANLKLAFDTADKLGVPALMDPEDMLMDCGPDKFSVITYVSQYFHKFKHFDKANGSDEVMVKAPVNPEDEVARRRQQIEQEKMLAKKCAKCQLGFPNGGTIIDALGKQYHPDCFVCFSCSKAFQDNKFVNVDSNPYCQSCAKDKFTSKAINSSNEQYENPPCFKCKKLCEGDTINALGHSWHPECFACTTCNKVFTSGASKVLNVDGYPYCEQCGRRAFVSRRTVTSPTPSQGMSKSKSMSAIPKMAETSPGEGSSPSSKPLLGSSNLGLSARLNAFQVKPEDAATKKPEPMKLKDSALTQRKQEEEQRKKKEEEEREAKRLKEEELKGDIKKQKEEEKQRKKQEEEEKKRKEQEEKEARKKEEEELKKKRAEDIKKKKELEEAKKKKELEEEEERKREKQEQLKRQRADSIAKKAEADEKKKKEEEEKKKKEQEEDEARKEALRKKREEMKAKGQEEEKKKEEATSKRTSVRFLHRSITETFVAHNKLADVPSTTTTTTKLPISSPNTSRPTSPVSTPRDNLPSPSITLSSSSSFNSSLPPSSLSSTSASSSSATPITPREQHSSSSSPSPSLSLPPSSTSFSLPTSLSHSSSSSSIVATLVATPRGTSISPAPSSVSLSSHSSTSPSSAAEKAIKSQTHGNIFSLKVKIVCPAADVMCSWTGPTESSQTTHSSSCPFFLLRPILLKLQQNNEDLAKKVEGLQAQQEKDREVITSLQAKLAH